MQKYDIHVCLISDQAAPNLLPILDTNFKPKKAIFLVSKKMKEKAEFLAKTFERSNVKVEIKPINDEYNFHSTEQEIYHLVEEYLEHNIALNVTCGTKLMAMAAQQAFSGLKPIFYIDTTKNRIIFVSKDSENNVIPDISIETNINIELYLNAYGFQVLNNPVRKVNDHFLSLAQDFIRYYDRYHNTLPLINKYASIAERKGLKLALDKEDMKFNAFTEMLENLDGLVDYQNSEIKFENETARMFLNGGWLEEYTFREIKNINVIDDVACSLDVATSYYKKEKKEFSKENLGNSNEFDVVFLAKNKLHIIECKTQKMDKTTGEKPENILYKLETLKDYGGLMTKKCLVSYCEITNKAVLNRAKELQIEIIQGKDLQRLKTKIQEWIGK